MTIVAGVPVHPLFVGVTVYVTVPVVDPEYVRICEGIELVLPDKVAPDTPELCTAVHEKLVPDKLDVRFIGAVDVPEQIDCAKSVLVITGDGLTINVSVAVDEFPQSFLTTKDIVYVPGDE